MSDVNIIPESLLEKYQEIISISDKVCLEELNPEYALLVKKAAKELCLLPESPIYKGNAKSWACGITHAIGMVNLLFDDTQKPHIKPSDLYAQFGVSRTTGLVKSKMTRDSLSMSQMDSRWSTQDRVCKDPVTWLFEYNGRVFDVRNSPITLQKSLFEKGLIPFIPGDKLGK